MSISALVTNSWYHLAAVRSGTNFMIFQNGVSLGASQGNTNAVSSYASDLNIGRGCWEGVLDGWIDEVRISKGIARWTANFTPPTHPY